MADILGREIKESIEKYLADPRFTEKARDPKVLERIRRDFPARSKILERRFGRVFADLEIFYHMLFDPDFDAGAETRRILAAVLIYFLNPFEYVSGGIPLVGLVDDRLVIACAAQRCREAIDRFAAAKGNKKKGTH